MTTVPNQQHPITAEVLEAARANPDGWVYKIEGQFGPDDPVPPQAIVGAWKVDAQGVPTGEFIPNPQYKPGLSERPPSR